MNKCTLYVFLHHTVHGSYLEFVQNEFIFYLILWIEFLHVFIETQQEIIIVADNF